MSYRTSKIYQGPSGGGGGSSPTPPGGETNIDITGLTVIDLTGKTNYSVINLISTNPNETINRIINDTTIYEREYRPQAGLVVSFNDDTVAPPVPTPNLKVPAPTVDIIGTLKGYIKFKSRSLGGVQYVTQYLDQYP